MQLKTKTSMITQAALLTAIGILIPMMMPIRIVIGPASFTLASHVPTMLAMFISPAVAAVVSAGTSLGFFLAGFPIVIVLRAASHIVFTVLGAAYLKQRSKPLNSLVNLSAFNIILNLIHALAEVIVVTLITGLSFDVNYLYSIILLVGVGTLLHGIIDFVLAFLLAESLVGHNRNFFPNFKFTRSWVK